MAAAAMKAKQYLHLFAEGAPSFVAFLLSIFIYVSVFNLSLSTLSKDTNFWFCISNTLIFILVADCGAFSPRPPNFHREGDRHRGNNAASKIPNRQSPDHNLNIIVRKPPSSAKLTQEEEEKIPRTPASIPLKFNTKKSYQQSKSEKVKIVVEKERKITVRRSKTMIKHDNASKTKKEEERKNDVEEMTDEELNRRVEEYIERFNRQIRLEDIGHGNE